MKNNYSLDDLRYFCVVAELSSFKLAAQKLAIPVSTLSRRIRHLENQLELRLLNRDAHRVLLTHTGQQYFSRFSQLFEEFAHLSQDLHNEKLLAKGKIRISAPISSSEHFLYPILPDFSLLHPEIRLELQVSNSMIDIEREAVDIAFRVGNIMVENWIARPLKAIKFILCASTNMDISTIHHPRDLYGMPAVLCTPMSTWQLRHSISGEEFDYQPTDGIRMEGNEVQMLQHTVKKGIGIGYIPDYYAYPMLDRGEVQRVLPDWQSKERTLYMLYKDRDNLPMRVRLFIEFILQRFSDL